MSATEPGFRDRLLFDSVRQRRRVFAVMGLACSRLWRAAVLDHLRAAMAPSSVSVIANVLRLRTVEFRDSIRERGT